MLVRHRRLPHWELGAASYFVTLANKLSGTTGTFWQRQYYDRLIRDADEYRSLVNDTFENPARAGVKNWKWVWRAEMGVKCWRALPAGRRRYMMGGGTPAAQLLRL